MRTKTRMGHLFIALFLLLTASGMSSQPGGFGPAALENAARQLVAAKTEVSPQALVLLGEPAIARYPYSGAVLFQYKFHDPVNDGFHFVALTPQGIEADVAGYDARELEAFARERGKLSPELWDLLAGSQPDRMVEVNIWLKMPPLDEADEQAFRKPDMNGEDIGAEGVDLQVLKERLLEREVGRVQAVTRPFVEYLTGLGVASRPNLLAPLVNTTLPAQQIRLLGARADVDTIYLAQTFESELNIARVVIKANFVQNIGINGTGVKVGMVENNGMVTADNPKLALTRDTTNDCPVTSHATGVAGVIRSTDPVFKGIAPRASLWAGCGTTDAELQTATTAGITWGAEVINLSWGSVIPNRAPGAMDRFMDRLVNAGWDTVVASAGNEGLGNGYVTSPGLAYNTITVGAFNDKGTLAWTDDEMARFSSFVDPASASGDREKPEVAAPGAGITTLSNAYPWIGFTSSGTSFAASMVTGTTALMMDMNDLLDISPEGVKAILMATASHNIEGSTRLSEKDGAGGIDAYAAVIVAQNTNPQGGWGYYNYLCYSSPSWNFATMVLKANKRTRVALVWDQDPDYASYGSKPAADLDLHILKNGVLVASSASLDNTYEIVDFVPAVTGTYTIRLIRSRCEVHPWYITWAWYQVP